MPCQTTQQPCLAVWIHASQSEGSRHSLRTEPGCQEDELANIQSAIKRMKQSEKRRMRNKPYRTAARTYVKKTRTAIAAGDLEAAQASVQDAISALDRAVQKGVIHKNNAARRKSRLMKALKSAQTAD